MNDAIARQIAALEELAQLPQTCDQVPAIGRLTQATIDLVTEQDRVNELRQLMELQLVGPVVEAVLEGIRA